MSVAVTYSIICDNCGARMSAGRKSPNLAPHMAYNEAKKKTLKAHWVERNCGSNGNKHYCRGCVENQPELATWRAQKLLTKV